MQISCREFTGDFDWVNERNTIDVTMESLIHATETYVAPPLRESGLTGWYALNFAYHKVYAIASVMNINNNTITLPEGYDVLDQSEKTVLSYYTGMTLAQLVADQILGIAEPIHAHSMKKCKILVTHSSSRSLPDIVGQDNEHRWHIIEAKCRHQKPNNDNIETWKTNQAKIEMTINGVTPEGTTSCCVTSQVREYSVDFVDPPTVRSRKKKEKVNIKIDVNELQRCYYQPFIELFKNNESIESYHKNEILFKPLGSDPLHKQKCCIGIKKSVFDQVTNGEKISGLKWESKKGQYMGSDGIAVKVSPYMRLHDCKKYHRHH